jgi:hypothetical protein
VPNPIHSARNKFLGLTSATDAIFSGNTYSYDVGFSSIRSIYQAGKTTPLRAELKICGAPKGVDSLTTVITSIDREETTSAAITFWFYQDDFRTRVVRYEYTDHKLIEVKLNVSELFLSVCHWLEPTVENVRSIFLNFYQVNRKFE